MAEFLGLIFVFIEIKMQVGPEGVETTCEFFFFENQSKDLGTHFFNIFEKSHLLYFMNMYNFIKYIFYSKIKKIVLYIYYYVIQIFLIIVYNNMPNKFVKDYLYHYYMLEKSVLKWKKYIMLGYVKKWRFWRYYYRFYHISYLKFLFFVLFFILFLLMWKRRNTYLKRIYIWNLILFYIFSIIISFLLWPLFFNKFLAICASLLIAFFIIYLRLN